MNKVALFENIDFADSEFRSCEMNYDNLIVYLTSWDAQTIRINFLKPIQFSCKLNDGIIGVYEIPKGSAFLQEALALNYMKVPSEHPYKLYQILDFNELAFVEVVAEEATAVKIIEK
ncbi:MAG: hypothetical protein JWO53_484 [Chlamydiia bacterium]|nr:hypothetical protein [Chlamydiia bacterium]